MNAFDYENDPITKEQVAALHQLLGDEWSDSARDGFLVISGRFIDETSTDRTLELASLFQTQLPSGRRVLRQSLEALFEHVGSLERFEQDFPVYINDPVYGSLGVFPQLPIIGIRHIYSKLYRLFDTNAVVYGSAPAESVKDYIIRTGRLPLLAPFPNWILREKSRIYWCSNQEFSSPDVAREALQILTSWKSDCRIRATLPASSLEGLVFVAYSGVYEYPAYVTNLSKNGDAFAGYNIEIVASDHPEMTGGGLQVGVVGEPPVARLEQWSDVDSTWTLLWENQL